MNKKTYESLKQKNYDEVMSYLVNRLRGNLLIGNTISYVVASSTLAFLKKENNDFAVAINCLEESINDEMTIYFLRNVKDKYFNEIEELAEKYDSATLKATALFSEPKKFSEADTSSTPEGITNLALSLLSVNKDDIVLDLGSGVSSFLIQAAYESNSNKIYGVEINSENVIVANIRSFITGLPIKVHQGNIISQEHSH